MNIINLLAIIMVGLVLAVILSVAYLLKFAELILEWALTQFLLRMKRLSRA